METKRRVCELLVGLPDVKGVEDLGGDIPLVSGESFWRNLGSGERLRLARSQSAGQAPNFAPSG